VKIRPAVLGVPLLAAALVLTGCQTQNKSGTSSGSSSSDKVTIMVVEQNAELALELASDAYVIETGRIVMSGPAAEISDNEDIRKSYLGY